MTVPSRETKMSPILLDMFSAKFGRVLAFLLAVVIGEAAFILSKSSKGFGLYQVDRRLRFESCQRATRDNIKLSRRAFFDYEKCILSQAPTPHLILTFAPPGCIVSTSCTAPNVNVWWSPSGLVLRTTPKLLFCKPGNAPFLKNLVSLKLYRIKKLNKKSCQNLIFFGGGGFF